MAIPDYQTIMLPLLKLTADQNEHQFRDIVETLAHEFKLSQEERKTLLPSGTAFLFDNRVGWARLYLVRAGLLESTRRGFVKMTQRGLDLLRKQPPKIDNEILKQYPEFVAFKHKSVGDKIGQRPTVTPFPTTINKAHPIKRITPVKIATPKITEGKTTWKAIENQFGITPTIFGKNINFVSESYKRSIIFRDVEHSFILASSGFSKPAVILAGGVIEELLRLYLEHKKVSPISHNFDGYVKTCEQTGLLKSGISRLTDSVRHFRNSVHLSEEQTKKHAISKAAAIGAVSSIFTISNDFL